MGKDIPRNSCQQPKCREGVGAYCVACNTQFGIGHGGRHDVKRHIERAAHIAFAIFIVKHNLPMAVGDEFGLLAKKMWCTTVPFAPPGGWKKY